VNKFTDNIIKVLYISTYYCIRSYRLTKLFNTIKTVGIGIYVKLMCKYFLASRFEPSTELDDHSTFVPEAPSLARHH
jgi:hypothetical protein